MLVLLEHPSTTGVLDTEPIEDLAILQTTFQRSWCLDWDKAFLPLDMLLLPSKCTDFIFESLFWIFLYLEKYSWSGTCMHAFGLTPQLTPEGSQLFKRVGLSFPVSDLWMSTLPDLWNIKIWRIKDGFRIWSQTELDSWTWSLQLVRSQQPTRLSSILRRWSWSVVRPGMRRVIVVYWMLETLSALTRLWQCINIKTVGWLWLRLTWEKNSMLKSSKDCAEMKPFTSPRPWFKKGMVGNSHPIISRQLDIKCSCEAWCGWLERYHRNVWIRIKSGDTCIYGVYINSTGCSIIKRVVAI